MSLYCFTIIFIHQILIVSLRWIFFLKKKYLEEPHIIHVDTHNIMYENKFSYLYVLYDPKFLVAFFSSSRYPVIPTLLTRISWWRICLDEAQMVESTVATAATEMALRLHCKHRWCVSGTPIQRKLDDLYGLLRFIKTSPFNIYRWWSEVIRDPYEVFCL
jgi:SNF2 family DNA or RNA helicase